MKNNNIDISIVIVNYNSMDYLIHCLYAIRKSKTNLAVETIVVDNNSSDSSIEDLRSDFQEVSFIKLDENIGFGSANNIGVKKSTGKYILILNPDTVIEENTLNALFDYMEENEDVGIAGCKVLNSDGTFQVACRRGFPTPWISFTKLFGLQRLFPNSRVFAQYNQTYKPIDETYEVDSVVGAFMFIRKTSWDKVNGFDESFFMYGEDIDLCYRVKQLGQKVVYFHQTSIIHYKGISTKRSSIDELGHFYESMNIFSRKHFSYSSIFLLFLKLGILIRKFFALVYKNKRNIFIIVSDLAVINISLMAATKIRFGGFFNFPDYAYPTVFIGISIVLVFSMISVGEYFEGKPSARKSFLALLISFFFLSSMTYFFKEYAFSRGVVLMTVGFTIIVSSLLRFVLSLFDNINGRGSEKRIAIIGTDTNTYKLYEAFNKSDIITSNIVGLISTKNPEVHPKIKDKIIGNYKYLHSVIDENLINEIIITDSSLTSSAVISLIEQSKSKGVKFHIAHKIDDFISSMIIEEVAGTEPGVPKLSINKFKNKLIKRGFDIILSLLVLTIGIPIVYLFSKDFKNSLKKWRLVFSGKLTIVGIYPSSAENSIYKAGLTGLAHISSPDKLSDETINKLNEYYLTNYSFLLDIEILIKNLIREKSGK